MERKNEGRRLPPHVLADRLDSNLSQLNFTGNLLKQERVLAWMVVASNEGYRVTRFDAERIGDHCLHSTVATIAKVYGLTIEGEWTKVPARFIPTGCCQYWLDPDQIEKAECLFSNPGVAA